MKKTTRILIPILLALFILVSIFWYLFDYDRTFTQDTLLSQARFHDLHGNSRISSWFYSLAYSFSGQDQNIAIELANQYKASGNYTKAEVTLTNAIKSDATAELYTALCRTYVEQDKLLDAVNLLDNITDPSIKDEVNALRPVSPTADNAPGYYSRHMQINLISDGTVFYTINGEYPSVSGPIFNGAIELPTGETTIYAISVSSQGLVSPLTVLSYTITGIIEPVTFTDPAMESAIRSLINVSADETVYTNQLWEITEFTVPEGVADYSDLSLMPYLQKLTIQNQQIPSLSVLSSLSQLTTVDLTGCKFPPEDLSYVAALPSLTSLTLAECGLSTVAGLSGAASLNYLNLSSNTLRNLEVLAPMTTLVELDLKHNAVTDLSYLQNLTNLQTLDVSYNALTTLSPLASCAKLSWLAADNNQLTDLSGVNSLPLLNHLSVDYNQLTDVSILAACTELTNLSIASNSITDISSLNTLTKLEIFDFSSNQISALPEWPDGCPLKTIDGSYNGLASIDSLKNMESLAYVYMDYNLLTSIDALADNYCLVQVNVFGNEIEDVSALREHDIIVNYDPT